MVNPMKIRRRKKGIPDVTLEDADYQFILNIERGMSSPFQFYQAK